MTEFTDGPAKGRVLLLRRSPLFLRVTVAEPTGRQRVQQFDALDHALDVPKPGETLFAYRRVAVSERKVHIRADRGASGWYHRASYRLCEVQPDQATMADRPAWESWCWSEKRRRAADCGPPQEST